MIVQHQIGKGGFGSTGEDNMYSQSPFLAQRYLNLSSETH